jgi:CRP-like cAMP-binding protein
VVLKLKHPGDYQAEEGARFEIHFEKARGLFGEAVRSIEATLTRDGIGNPIWTHRWAEGATAASVIQLRRDGLSAAEIATELGVNRSTVYRALKKAEAEATLTTGGEHG